MPSPAFSSKSRFLSSRVARRIFLLFVLCAFLPLVLFASLSLFNVTSQLERQAEARLDEACKATGMTVVERLGNVQHDILLHLEGRTTDILGAMERASEEFRRRWDERVEWAVVGDAEGHVVEGRETIVPPKLDANELRHLAAASCLIKYHGTSRKNVVQVFPVERTEPPVYLFVKVRPNYIWGGEDLLRPNSDIIALSDRGDLLYTSRKTSMDLVGKIANAARQYPAKGQLEGRDHNEALMASYRTMFTQPQFFRNFVVAYSQSRAAVVAPVETFENLFVLFSLLTFCSVVFASLIQIRRSMVPIEMLTGATKKIKERDFSTRIQIQTKDEFRDLGRSFNGMVQSLENYSSTMETLHRVGVALTAEQSSKKLIELVVDGSHRVSEAEIVLLHLVDDNERLRTAYLSSRTVGGGGLTISLDFDLCAGADTAARRTTAVVKAVTTGQTVQISDISRSEEFHATPYEPIEELLGFKFRSVLCAPMKNHENQIIGVLELINATDASTGRVRPFSTEERHVAESLASQAAVALTKNQLVDDFRNMFEALTELIATAIDEKSKYTGDHCRRVPILTMMIAQEVCSARSGACADVSLSSDELYELKVAALLHDCGKVTTPVHVVDKATKLEKIIDRIDLVDTRFEVVRRDLHIKHLERIHGHGVTEDSRTRSEAVLRDKLAMLDDDRQFLRKCNIGGEFMSDADMQRVRDVAQRYEWVNPAGLTESFLTEDEVENLCVFRGTLTAAEREVVNYHVVATIKMLERLPYPRHLTRVPEIAGAHHEKMDGTGYPMGLDRSEITLQGRILGIADVFEALTAKDRPYKPGRTLSETLIILGKMKESGHIDGDLFQLFVESGVYLRYARDFLDPEQIDAVDLAKIPGFELAEPAEAMA